MRYVAQRLAQFVVVFVVVTFIVLASTRIGSTDPVQDLAGGQVDEARRAQVLEDYPYLDKPLPIQYGYWITDLVKGDWGYSYYQSQSVMDMFKQRAPATFFIVFWSIVMGLLIALPVGVYSAYRRDRLFDRASSVTTFGFISMPSLVVSVALLYLVAARYDMFPTVGGSDYVAPWDNPYEHFKNFFLPSLAIGIGIGGVWSRLLRADMALTLQSDFVTLAKAKGLSPGRILWIHALRASILSLITSVALQLGSLISGAIIAEQFFGPRGLGDRLVFAIQQNDLLTLQAIGVVIVAVVVVANLAVDLMYAVVDPRIRAARALS
ncbi:MAG: ABC transporter permease [Actinomycetota bacterium]|nr:ABC transporter permease [Acidimicrobiia bacterium]MDQ3352471.1 ABC transporter permease [Actinomycetota bacterium]